MNTWIIGSSLVHWAYGTAMTKNTDYPALSKRSTKWYGTRGMKWYQLLPRITALLREKSHPRVLIIHLGGNDLTSTPLKVLIEQIKCDLSKIQHMMPKTQIVWSDVTTRIRYKGANSNAKAEKARKTLNASVRPHVTKLDGFSVRHPLIIWTASHLFRKDGVHLSDRGNCILLQDWQDGLQGLSCS